MNGLPGEEMAGQSGECLVGQSRSVKDSGHDEEVSPQGKLDNSMELICTWSFLATILVLIQSYSNERKGKTATPYKQK